MLVFFIKMIKQILIVVIIFLVVGAIVLCIYFKPRVENKLYQGPVPEGYDEEHFRKTGETIIKENGS